MKLTIGMIVKNEEKWLDKCLSAIRPILDNVDCELIITDTGSTDRTVEIAEKYTDKILHFDWINDFSAARNFGLEQAKGEWFMFLDADDIFRSCDNVIAFFNSGEYRKYNSATYVSRNLTQNGVGSDLAVRRLTKILPETRFNGVIHEHLNTHGAPVKHLQDIADHYGYVYNTDADRKKKFDRNYFLLLKKYEQVKDKNPMIYAELYDTLAVGFRQKEADDYLDKGIEWCIEHENPILLLLYCKKARHLLFEKQNDKALEVCGQYFDMSPKIRRGTVVSDAEILVIKATVYYRQEQFEKCFDALCSFFAVYDDIRSGALDTEDKMYGSLSLASDSNYISYIGQLLVCGLNTCNYGGTVSLLSKLTLKSYPADNDTIESIVSLEAALLEKAGYDKLGNLCSQLNDYGREKLMALVGQRTTRAPEGETILTVGMIVKNEEKYLDKCLSAIKPILDNVSSELIITDTGSTDRTVEIAKKYTDKVLHFNWTDDFAAARNTAFEAACGKWFMFLDADEIFRSCDNIITFFNSGEYRKFNSATFLINNLTRDGGAGSAFRAQRLTCIKPGTRFTGRVHELLNTYGEPIKHLGDTADHYGYMFADDAEAKKKSERNTKLLLKSYNSGKVTDPMIFVQLYDSFMTGMDHKNAVKYMELGIKYCREHKHIVLAVLYVKKAYDEVSCGRYEDAISTCLSYLQMDRSIRKDRLVSDKEILAVLASSYLRTKQYPEAQKTFAEYFDVYEMVENGTLDTPDADAISFRASAEHNYLPFVNAFLNCCMFNNDYDTAVKYLAGLPLYDHSQNISDLNDTISFEVKILEKVGIKYLDAFCSQLDEYGKNELRKAARRLTSASDAGNEMQKLAEMLKSNVRAMIANGKYEDAGKFLNEYSKINPGDSDIEELRKMIGQ